MSCVPVLGFRVDGLGLAGYAGSGFCGSGLAVTTPPPPPPD